MRAISSRSPRRTAGSVPVAGDGAGDGAPGDVTEAAGAAGVTAAPEAAGAPSDDRAAAGTGRDGGRVVRREPGPAERDHGRFVRRARRQRFVLAITVPVVLFALWELAAAAGWIDERFYARPSAVWAQGVDLVSDGTLFSQAWITVRRLVIGYVLGSAAGVVVGLLLSQFRLARAAFEPMLRALYVIPKLAILPILLLVLGIGEGPKIAFIAIGTFFILAFSTLSAASMIPTAYHEVAASYGLSRSQRFKWLVLPASLPQIVDALRLASGIAVLLVVAAEFVQSNDGLGYLTWHSWELFLADRMYLGIVAISVLGVAFGALVSWLGSHLVRWTEQEYDGT